MSTSIQNLYCKCCHRSLPNLFFIRNETANTYFKTCEACRSRNRIRRMNSHRQQSVPQPLEMPAGQQTIMNTGPISFNNQNFVPVTDEVHSTVNTNFLEPITDNVFCKGCKRTCPSSLFTDPVRNRTFRRCSDCRQRDFNRRHPQANPVHQNINTTSNTTENIGEPRAITVTNVENTVRTCSMCLRNRSLQNFTGISNEILLTCEDCRSRVNLRRHPPIFSQSNTQLPMVNFGNETSLYGESDEEIDNMGADIGHFEIEEPVVPDQAIPEEARMDIDPLLLFPQQDTVEFRVHLEMQRQLQMAEETRNINSEEIDLNIDHNGDQVVEEQTMPDALPEDESPESANIVTRRLPTWMTARASRARAPAGYLCRYNQSLAAHDLGSRSSVCPSCKAIHFSSERVKSSSITAPRFQTCCKEGQVVLDSIPDPPDFMRELWTSEEQFAKNFRHEARKYNCSFAFTSFNFSEDRRLETLGIRGGIRSFSVHGEVYHQIGAVARQGHSPIYAQLYFLDPDQANEHRVQRGNLNVDIVTRISSLIAECNPFYEFYHRARDALEISNEEHQDEANLQGRAILDVNYRLIIEQGADRRRENLPTVQEFAVVMPDTSNKDAPEVVLFVRNSDGSLSERLQYIHRGHPAYLPLHYVLFYPYGNPGYRWRMRLATRTRRVLGNDIENEEGTHSGQISARQFYRYHLFSRQDTATSEIKFNVFIHGERLFQQLLCDMYACVDDNILTWHRKNQDKIRADLYKGVIDALRTDESARNIGQPIILASSYHGGDRHMTKCYQNAMAITRSLGKPTLFITFTANPNWVEIRRSLEHGQSSDARPDLIAIVFKQKLDALLHDLKEREIFGKCTGCVYTIEYQKRGLPHAHILLFLQQDDIPRCADHVDELVQAKLPTNDAILAQVIKTQMTHGPCGPDFPNSVCMREGKCSKGFPKRFCEQTTCGEIGYPEYARPQDGQTWGNERFMFDNRWIVPYNPYLTKKYCAHINVEVAKGVHAIKYLAKYVYKGSDRATLAVGDRYDEISMTIQGRYISPAQAVWRLLEYTTHQEKPAVMNLPFHLENCHNVIFSTDLNPLQMEAAVESQSSPFLDWMSYNSANVDGRDLLYTDFPLFYTHVKTRGWHQRSSGQTIGRMPIAHPTQGEHYYLRTLLTVRKGVRSYRDLYTVDGVYYERASATCVALGLISDDSEWVSFFDEIKEIASASSLRQTFATAIANSSITNPQSLWDRFRDSFTDDCMYRIRNHGQNLILPPEEWSEETQRNDYGLWLLGDNLRDLNQTWEAVNLEGPRHRWLSRHNNPLIAEATCYNLEEEKQLYENALASLSLGQRSAHDCITNAIDNGLRPNTFFVQGPAGTGKTFLYKTLCQRYRSQGKIVLCAASSGIAALLLPGGRTSHSLFRIPIDSDENSVCRIPASGHLANLLRSTHLIIWDEVTLQNKTDFSAVDKYLRFLYSSDDLFGGVPVVLGGDFAQILPVVRRGRREQIVNACIQTWTKWPLIQQIFLTENMRVIQGCVNQRFAEWLSNLPYNANLRGELNVPEWVRTTVDRKVFQEFVFPRQQISSTDYTIFTDRAILSSRNDSVRTFNNEIAALRAAQSREYFSRDEVKDDEAGHISDYPVEFLQTLSTSGLPQGVLNLQVGMPVMLLRNLYPNKGLCNGTRLIITRLFHRGIQGRIVSTDIRYNGEEHFIHRIPLTSSEDLPFTLIRNQLPLRPCFAMTINKSQGQTLKCVGVDLSTPVFSHGQLYVALSRVTDVAQLIILLPSGANKTNNIVYPEVLLRPPQSGAEEQR